MRLGVHANLIQSCPTLCNAIDTVKLTRLHCARDSPGTHPGVGCHSLLEGIFLSQGSNPRLSCLLQWQVDSLHLSHRGSPLNLFPAMCTEAAAVPGVETGQQIPLSLDLHWPIKYLPSQVVDSGSTRKWSKAFSSSVTPTMFQVLSCIMWPGARVLDRAAVWKVLSSSTILLDIPRQITEWL